MLPPDDVGSAEPATVRKLALKDRLIAALRAIGPSTIGELIGHDAAITNKRPARETVSRRLNELKREGQVRAVDTPGQQTVWHLVDGRGSDDSAHLTKGKSR